MERTDALVVLAVLSSRQWGLFTTRQAATRGISRLVLSRLAEAGHIDRVRHGVYRDAGAAVDEFDEMRAAWLSTDPDREAEVRQATADAVVVSGVSAAELHGIGDLRADRFEFTIPVRKQSQRPDIRFRVGAIEESQITLRHGLPVTTTERTVADLIEQRVDITHVAGTLADAMRVGSIELRVLAEYLAPLAARHGLGKGDGAGLVDRLLKISGLDIASTAERIASMESLAGPIATSYLTHLAAETTRVKSQLGLPHIDMTTIDAFREIATSLENAMRPQREAMRQLSKVAEPIAGTTRLAELLAPMAAQAATIAKFSEQLRAGTGASWPQAAQAVPRQ